MKGIHSAKEINGMPYTDFVGFINQWNVLPGAHTTLSKWAIFSKMDKNSNILEIACSTGFSSRELAILTGCRGKAFDISKSSVKAAVYNKKAYAPNTRISYFIKDGYQFKSSQKFSHIIIGAALRFFPEPERMLNKCISLLKEGGIILASPFYIKSRIPKKLILEFKKVFGIQPTIESYKNIMKTYQGLEILFEERNNLLKETKEEIKHYCHSTIKRVCKLRNISDKRLYNAMFQRLYKIKIMSNKLRPYQGYSVLVLRYRSNVYPNRYVELF
ncbi:MAG: class I SAM-dependent methyltransferase [Nanoarchaeota archaeon]|nr:class I SAM-dependent methyltransferase [Nanoarchaeota archaeon]